MHDAHKPSDILKGSLAGRESEVDAISINIGDIFDKVLSATSHIETSSLDNA